VAYSRGLTTDQEFAKPILDRCTILV
jgi:hypothetical protein